MTAKAFWKSLGFFGEPKRQDWRCSACKRDLKFKENADSKTNLKLSACPKNSMGHIYREASK